MALIDISEIINDPDFQDTITLTRRTETISDYGETMLSDVSSTMNAVVQSGNGETLARNLNYAVMSDWITVYAQFDFITDGNGNYADRITWNGRSFLVKTVTDFMNWGLGYTRADCLIEGAQ